MILPISLCYEFDWNSMSFRKNEKENYNNNTIKELKLLKFMVLSTLLSFEFDWYSMSYDVNLPSELTSKKEGDQQQKQQEDNKR
jgi:hypothetical protein